ncbi:Ig-like domain-containing protein [Pedosphaera parvula]|uniref:Low-density lipoprotein receptor n=1 Tax=Pedosphaera parvula (strain Ellin514) TaxID=320771 RepID=B9XBK3_PEDPL|nr:Ig-like domain-containing protein [Pedosphaera parvula]EEF62888.1 low-density lipoprotein receptor [Pedosphaera parvula Ellin514]
MHLNINRVLSRLVMLAAAVSLGDRLSAQQLFFTTSSSIAANDRVTRINVSGPNSAAIVYSGAAAFSNPNGVAVDAVAGKIFFADGNGTNCIRAANLNGTGPVTNLVNVGINISGLALDPGNQKIYFTTSSSIATNARVMRVNYDGTGLTTLYSGPGSLSNPSGIAVDAGIGKMFVTDANSVKEANLNGTGALTNLYTAGINVTGVALDSVGQKVYLTYASGGSPAKIGRVNYNGTGVTVLFTASTYLANPTGLALDVAAGKMYIADGLGGNGVQVANLDGSGTPASLYAAGIHVSGVSAVQNLLTIAGAVTNQATLDTASLSPFSNVTITDYNASALTVTVQLDNVAKGTFTALGGFLSLGSGSYSFSGTGAAVTTAIRQMVFKPAQGRVARGLTETSFFKVTANDGSLFVTNTTTTVVSTAANRPPVANADRFDHPAGQPMAVPVSSLLANDTDQDGDPLTVQSVDAASALGVAVSLSGTNVLYGASANLATDTFHYVINDAHGGTATGLVTITVSSASISLAGTNKVLNFTRTPNLTYRVQYNTNLLTTNWTTLASVVSDAVGHLSYTNLGPTEPMRFYRSITP